MVLVDTPKESMDNKGMGSEGDLSDFSEPMSPSTDTTPVEDIST